MYETQKLKEQTYPVQVLRVDEVGGTKAGEPREEIAQRSRSTYSVGAKTRAHDLRCDGVASGTLAHVVEEHEKRREGDKNSARFL